MNVLTQLTTPLAFAFSTMAVLWSFGGGDLATFWQRSLALSAALVVLLFATPGYSLPIIKDLFKRDFWAQKSTTTAAIAGVAMALPFSLLLVAFAFWTLPSMPWLRPFLQNIANPTWYAYLLLPLIVAPILELYWRGLIAPQWGTFTTAFLEGLIWGFAGQHVIYFLGALISSLLIRLLIQRTYGIQAALVAKAVWTLLILVTLAVI